MCNQNEKGFVDPLVTEGEHDHEFVCTLTDSVCVFCGVSQNTDIAGFPHVLSVL